MFPSSTQMKYWTYSGTTEINRLRLEANHKYVTTYAAEYDVHRDGTYDHLDTFPIAGKTFVGLGRLVTGERTFEDLLALAEQGDDSQVHAKGRDLCTGVSEDLYRNMRKSDSIYEFGRVVGRSKGAFEKCDLAASMLSATSQELAQIIFLLAATSGVDNIFVCGGYVAGSQLVRDEMGRILTSKSICSPLNVSQKYWFLRYGAYLGVLGALLKTLLHTSH